MDETWVYHFPKNLNNSLDNGKNPSAEKVVESVFLDDGGKGNNFYDFLFAFPHNKSLLKRDLL